METAQELYTYLFAIEYVFLAILHQFDYHPESCFGLEGPYSLRALAAVSFLQGH